MDSINWNSLKKIRELGHGMVGTTYLVEDDIGKNML